MQQLLAIWKSLSAGRRLVVVGATVAMFVAVLGMTRVATAPSLSLLYSGLDERSAGDVISALESRNIIYEVEGTSIYVPMTERDSLRLSLASEGLPSVGDSGYELLDSLTGFGTTSQMFDAAYWRAKEGELARTLVAGAHISKARVHIAVGSSKPFQRESKPSASVSVTGTNGPISGKEARAIRHLVASAVQGLLPDDVSVVDAEGGLIGDGTSSAANVHETMVKSLRERVLRLVEARVGAGNAVVEVSVNAVQESESVFERRFDPDSRFVISSETEERTGQSQDEGGAGVTVASNLPDGAGGSGAGSSNQESETRERVNYEVSETTREVTRTPDAVRRVTVAVLVNGTFEQNADGQQAFVPMPAEDQAALRELVSSAVGFDEARGDVITVHSMPFKQTEGLGSVAAVPGFFERFSPEIMKIARIGVLGLIIVAVGAFVLRPILTNTAPALPDRIALEPAEAPLRPMQPALDGEIDSVRAFNGTDGAIATVAPPVDPAQRLRGLVDERREEAVEILRSWLDEPEEQRR
ncbi:MAG: flagellar basal-body MS-ring/collar protein FliF [Pseudomonadota bacterium]|nr:flagellar basal-body MS-ring/collar protein FliF [Pseudomonadota bacterium]